MPLFHKNPNLCASVFNDELHAAFGKNRVIPLFKHFTANGRLWHGGLGGSSPTICQKFYNRDGLHFNMTGSKLLGALISQFIFKGLQENPTKKKLALAKPAGSPTSSMGPVHVPRPNFVFNRASSPPPSIADLNHFPPLLVSEEVGSVEQAVLTGYNDAVSRVVEQLPLQHREKKDSCRRKCKSNSAIIMLPARSLTLIDIFRRAIDDAQYYY